MRLGDIPKEVQIIGAGGHAKVVIQTLRLLGVERILVFDDNPHLLGQRICKIKILGKTTDAAKNRIPSVIAIGDNEIRKRKQEELQLPWLTIIHPRAFVDPSVSLGEGSVVFAGAIIQVDSLLGKHSIVNTAASIDHDCQIGDFAHIGPGAHCSGGVRIGEGVLMGVSVCAKPSVSIGSWSTLGAGATVVSDLPANIIAMGVPAKVASSKL